MAKLTMSRTATDNAYLHRDFHGALSVGIDYLEARFGPAAVHDYLRQFTLAFYAPLRSAVADRGLGALKEHFERLYATEEGDVECRLSGDELTVTVPSCPAVTHMRQHGYRVAHLFGETTRTVNEALCEGTPFAAALLSYDPETGRSVQRFYRRAS